MPIKVVCKCGQKFSANDKMAGKRVKCPKCSQPLQIPDSNADDEDFKLAPETPKSPPPRGAGLLDLLDEAQVKRATTGPVCPDCGADMKPDAIICLECGFNITVGERMSTYADEDENDGLSETEKMLAKAERELEETPTTIDDSSFGDGPESILIALGALIAAAVVVGSGIGIVFLIDMTEGNGTGYIILGLGSVMFMAGLLWVTIAAFLNSPAAGIGCLLCFPFALIYSFSRRKTLWMPMVLMAVGILACLMSTMMFGAPEGA